ncbi:hypothetical protein [Pseudarthrobacter sp. NS4]|uniref:hypothetical protein n=1 Tax=Pseudarthrobacter sp. NS4 TaxID=2973976 RepID=UPI002162C816|nr:hypothetical protein [Pseudarthrobacter sp. NS4]
MTARSAFLRRWVGWVTLGESLGFLAPALAQLMAAALWPAAMVPLLIIAGSLEGAVLGWFQVKVLRTRLPAVSVRRWVLFTAAAAAVAWTLGLLPAAGIFFQAWRTDVQIAAGTVAAVVLLVSIGFAQWIELREHIPGAWRWVPGSAGAWAAGLAVFIAASTPLWQPGQDLWLVAAIGIAAAVLMAVTMAAVSGLVMVQLLKRLEGRNTLAGRPE